ncbi:MAG: hypothetical protein KatS3mg121_0835 [Gammaproteobacteria bacterium]|nr:MAG: hypothetical protein KatS3mg121_0835 [Gammaproteobacteria bacterium]
MVAVGGGRVRVAVERGGACGGCAVGCGSSLTRWLRPAEFELPADRPYRVGEPVLLRLPERALLQAASLAYVPPLAGMGLSLAAAGAAGLGDAAALACALAGFAAGQVFARRRARRRWPVQIVSGGP